MLRETKKVNWVRFWCKAIVGQVIHEENRKVKKTIV